MVKCPECYSTELYKNGKDKKGNQKYLCKKCRRQFTLKSIKKLNNPKWPACCKDTFSGHRFSINTIINAINLYYSLNVTTIAISTYLLDYMNIKVSHVTISKWIKKFDKYYLWICIDSETRFITSWKLVMSRIIIIISN